VPGAHRGAILTALSGQVAQARLFYPDEVFRELERQTHERARASDEVFRWIEHSRARACSVPATLDRVKEVLSRVDGLVDADAVDEPADPYVLAQALELREMGGDVLVVTDDAGVKPGRTSLAAAAGVFRFPSLPMETYLADEGMWRRK